MYVSAFSLASCRVVSRSLALVVGAAVGGRKDGGCCFGFGGYAWWVLWEKLCEREMGGFWRKAEWKRLMTIILVPAGPASCRAEDPYVRDESGGEGRYAAEEEVMGGGGWGLGRWSAGWGSGVGILDGSFSFIRDLGPTSARLYSDLKGTITAHFNLYKRSQYTIGVFFRRFTVTAAAPHGAPCL